MDKDIPVLSDAPVGLEQDELGFGRYVDPWSG